MKKLILLLFTFLYCSIIYAQLGVFQFTSDSIIDANTNRSNIVVKDNSTDEKSQYTSGIDLENLTNKLLREEKSYYSDEKINHFISLQKNELGQLDDTEIELKMNAIATTLNVRVTPDIANQIRYYIFKNRAFVVDMLTKAEYFFPLFEVELDNLNVPLELKYLAVIESHLKTKAKSYMGATGLWQFMYATAKYKGMKITTLEDQRRDPIIATQYAGRYLKQLHGIYDDWLLAMSAYNAGAGNINKAIRHSGGVKNYWVARPFMPRETQKYIPRIIAIMYVMYYAEDYLLYPRRPNYDYYSITQIEIPERLTLKYASELLGVDSFHLAELNPMLIKNLIPSREDGYKLNIPVYAQYVFEENQHLFNNDPYLTEEARVQEEKSVSRYSTPGTGKYSTYTIRSGDNLGYIAQLYGCRVSDIKRWNGMYSNMLKIGKKLKIYSNKKVQVSSNSTANNNVKVGFGSQEINESTCNCYKHKIISGDSLWAIANKYSSSIEKIKRSNNIYQNWKLKLGTYLKVPK